MTDLFLSKLKEALDAKKSEGLKRELKLPPPFRINLAQNDYLNLSFNKQVLDAANHSNDVYGTSSSASPLLYGHLPCHQDLIDKLCAWKNKPSGMLFNTGFMANQAVLSHLPGKNDLILADHLVHHSIIQGFLRSDAAFKRYSHLDLEHLGKNLKEAQRKYETIFVVTESVFSMDGDYPDLKQMAELKKAHPFVWILDEAHGTGVFGDSGAGLAEKQDVMSDIDIIIGTLGKALGSMGAYVLSQHQKVIDYLINFSGEFIYSTFMSPSLASAASKSIDLVKAMHKERSHLHDLGQYLRHELSSSGWQTNDYDSQIVPVVVGDAKPTLTLQKGLLESGILVSAVRPPTVPPHTSRLRISLHSAIQKTDLDEFLDKMNRLKIN